MKLEAKNITKRYGQKTALRDFSISFTPGVYGLLGPNGAGKSTLMRILSGNILPNSGSILYDNENILSMGGRYRDIIGYMPQQQNLYDSFNARRFLRYIAVLKGLSKRVAEERVESLLHLVGLQNDAHRSLGGFSGGMKQRVLIAQALLNDPQILLMDEPTAGLDPRERIKIRNFISEISFNKTVILATHIVSDIEYIAKEVILLNKGQIIIDSDPDEIINMMHGHVFELIISESDLGHIRELYKISNVTKEYDSVVARIVVRECPKGFHVRTVKPNMEDVYLYYFED